MMAREFRQSKIEPYQMDSYAADGHNAAVYCLSYGYVPSDAFVERGLCSLNASRVTTRYSM